MNHDQPPVSSAAIEADGSFTIDVGMHDASLTSRALQRMLSDPQLGHHEPWVDPQIAAQREAWQICLRATDLDRLREASELLAMPPPDKYTVKVSPQQARAIGDALDGYAGYLMELPSFNDDDPAVTDKLSATAVAALALSSVIADAQQRPVAKRLALTEHQVTVDFADIITNYDRPLVQLTTDKVSGVVRGGARWILDSVRAARGWRR